MVGELSRRDALRLAGSTFSIGIGGCLSSVANQSPSPSTSPTDTPNNIGADPVPNCPDGYTATYDPGWEIVGNEAFSGFDLTVDQETYAKGERLVATLRNLTDRKQPTGIKEKVDIQYQGADGWHTIFGVPEGESAIFPAIAITHPPGEVYTWELTLSKTGLAAGDDGDLPSFLHACHPIKPGQYRFVYWGVSSAELVLGVPFEVIQEED